MAHGKSRRLRIVAIVAAALCMLGIFSGCVLQRSDMMKDGYYTAVAAEFDEHGWKEYITIYVSGGTIVTTDYNAKNASGFIKSWDMEYMRVMNHVSGTYPNEYTRLYAEALMNTQNAQQVDAITGATHSYHTFVQLADAAIAQARSGDKSVCFVEIVQG